MAREKVESFTTISTDYVTSEKGGVGSEIDTATQRTDMRLRPSQSSNPKTARTRHERSSAGPWRITQRVHFRRGVKGVSKLRGADTRYKHKNRNKSIINNTVFDHNNTLACTLRTRNANTFFQVRTIVVSITHYGCRFDRNRQRRGRLGVISTSKLLISASKIVIPPSLIKC